MTLKTQIISAAGSLLTSTFVAAHRDNEALVTDCILNFSVFWRWETCTFCPP